MAYQNNIGLSFWFDCLTNKQTNKQIVYTKTGFIFKLMVAQLMKIFFLLSNPHVTYRVCKSLSLVPILGQVNVIYTLTSFPFNDNIQILHINAQNRKMY
jgi:uncharacterized protein YacL